MPVIVDRHKGNKIEGSGLALHKAGQGAPKIHEE